jgi:hypothetical protein
MSEPLISVIMPSIRPFLLNQVYSSVLKGCKDIPFELVVISPYAIPEDMAHISNIKLIQDYGQPSRCAQMGLIAAKGTRVTLLSDDCIVHDNAYIDIEKQFSAIEKRDGKKFIGLKYSEGVSMNNPSYWRAKHHPPLQLDGLRDDMPVSSMIYINKDNLIDIGGWDCSIFECINWGGHDLTARLLNDGYVFELTPDSFCKTLWGPGIDGLYNDHRPLWESDSDGQKNLKALWSTANSSRTKVPLENWESAPSVWKRRFK